jgi:hypothetical protein
LPQQLHDSIADSAAHDGSGILWTEEALVAPLGLREELQVEPDLQLRRAEPASGQAGLFLWLLFLAGLLVLVRVSFARSAREWVRALGNMNLAQQWIRNREYAWSGHSAILFAVFAGSMGTWLWWSLNRFFGPQAGAFEQASGLPLPMSGAQGLALCVMVVVAVVFLRDALRRLIGLLFHAEEESDLFGFQITMLNAVAGIALLPLLLLMVFAPGRLPEWAWYSSMGLLGLLFLARAIRGLQLSAAPLRRSPFAMIVYICTLEIAPLAVAFRFISNWFTGV